MSASDRRGASPSRGERVVATSLQAEHCVAGSLDVADEDRLKKEAGRFRRSDLLEDVGRDRTIRGSALQELLQDVLVRVGMSLVLPEALTKVCPDPGPAELAPPAG